MLHKIVGLGLMFILLAVFGFSTAAQEQKKSFRVIGELKSQKNSPNGRNTMIEVLAPGEGKARRYWVGYDPKVKGPIPSVLKAVREAKIGDTVEMECIQTGEGLVIRSFQVLKKGSGGEKKGDNNKDIK